MTPQQLSSDKVILVYNKSAHDCLIAAAAIHAANPDLYRLCEIGDNIPEGHKHYLWLGTHPSKVKTDTHQTHQTCVAQKSESSTQDGLTDLAYRHTVMDLVLELLPQEPVYKSIAYHVACFHDKSAEISQLAFVYELILRAHRHLHYSEAFVPPVVEEFFHKDTQRPYIDAYTAEMKRIEPILNQGYNMQKVRSDGEIVYAAYTTQAGLDYHLMLRRIRLTHAYYLNIRTGLQQTLVHTNIPDIKLDLDTDYLKTIGH